jgi:hypothetical protein
LLLKLKDQIRKIVDGAPLKRSAVTQDVSTSDLGARDE